MGHEAKRRRKAFLSASISAIHRLAVTLALPPPQPSSLQSLQVGNVAMKKEPLIGRDRHWMSTLISSNMDHLPLVRQGWREGDPSPHTQIHMLWHRSECLPPPSLPPPSLPASLPASLPLISTASPTCYSLRWRRRAGTCCRRERGGRGANVCQAVAGRHLAAVCGGWHSSSRADPARCWHGLPPPPSVRHAASIHPSGRSLSLSALEKSRLRAKHLSLLARSWPTSSHAFGGDNKRRRRRAATARGEAAGNSRQMSAPSLLPRSLLRTLPPFECL